MPINTRTLVLAAVAENAIGVPLQRGLPVALFASTFRPMTGLIFALLIGRTLATRASSGFSIVVPPAGGGAGGAGGRAGGPGAGGGAAGGAGAGGAIMPSSMPSFLHMSPSDARAWAAFFGLQPTFEQTGPRVVSQEPRVGAATRNDKTVELELGPHPPEIA